jgi:dihydrofolate synthase / folylpolyglutamate synthase
MSGAVESALVEPHAERIDAGLMRLLALHPKLIDLSLARIERLLALLEHPERRLPPVIHVAGTNGKGSTVAMLAALARAHGLNAHTYTSPHLVRFNERIGLCLDPHKGAQPIPDELLLAYLERVEQANGSEPITFFEITTAMAMLAFAEHPADLVILETGLGGRVDATNVIAAPAVTVITPVGMDHMGFLGETLAAIAGEKAGIIKPGRPLLLAPQQPAAEQVIRERAGSLDAPVHMAEPYDGPGPALPGAHQRVNAATALKAFELFLAGLGRTPEPAAVTAAMQSVIWPARLQRLDPAVLLPLSFAGQSDINTRNWHVWLDGAHNPEGFTVLMAALAALIPATEPADLILGVMANKDLDSMASRLGSRFGRIVAVPVPGTPAGLPADQLAERLRQIPGLAGSEISEAASAPTAFAHLVEKTQDSAPRTLVIAGSLYLAGAVLGHAGRVPPRLSLIGV